MLCRLTPGTGNDRYGELKTLLQGLAEFAPGTLFHGIIESGGEAPNHA